MIIIDPCLQTCHPRSSPSRAGADRRRRAFGLPGGRAEGGRGAVAGAAKSLPRHRRHFGRCGGGQRAGGARRPLAAGRRRRSSKSGRISVSARYSTSAAAGCCAPACTGCCRCCPAACCCASPRSLFDNSPLRELLKREVPWRGVGRSMRGGHLDALALCCHGYGTARSVAFFQGARGHQGMEPRAAMSARRAQPGPART